ncbi:iron-sulfur assembly protein, putative [Plasmodium ovale wallikeri]|uniref:Iron-sulfur assembly protein, putative n=1 Tax=Plasmodium ovale wallikeri TaxID=864142 RepID=A0A1A8YYF9_PLAOA|nr:iron-sulfur assembly protein, putative [Plasmodium ovale wallikeri]SBT36499.1 iron-sulfur assembly protein, putative [Plasmodium ovale wallikeri]
MHKKKNMELYKINEMNQVARNEKTEEQSNCRVSFTFHFMYMKENKKTMGREMKRYEDNEHIIKLTDNAKNKIMDEIEADDYVQQFDELKFILSIDATSVIYIYNNILDYSSDLINGGFKYVYKSKCNEKMRVRKIL